MRSISFIKASQVFREKKLAECSAPHVRRWDVRLRRGGADEASTYLILNTADRQAVRSVVIAHEGTAAVEVQVA